jgi:hypothetical protein
MEKKMYIYKKVLAVLLVSVLPLVGCIMGPESQNNSLSNAKSALVQIQGTYCVALLAGQSIPAGTVCTSIEGENLKVTYATENGWLLYEAHLWAGMSLSSMPQTNSGNPKLGNFPYNSGALAGVSSYSFLVPLSTFGLSSSMTACDPKVSYLVAHAVVKKQLADGSFESQTAYGEGNRLVQKGNWAMWFSVTLTCTGNDPEVGSCETAFAYSNQWATCFIGSSFISTNRWGWTNGPIGPGSYSFDIYAGAGQCDLSKGTYVGTLSVVYDGSVAQVTYTMQPGFTMSETHLYIGSEPLPRNDGEYTVAPGQYGNIHNLSAATSDSFNISGLSGDIYVVAHAVTCSGQ